MARIARITGIVLIVLGAVYFFLTGAAHPTSLIASLFGLILLVCGVLANTPDAKKRMLWMHIAVTVGLLGFLFPAIMGGMAVARRTGLRPGEQNAVAEQMIMAVICLIFVVLCVRSFIAARVGRTAALSGSPDGV